jgi:hypothetical protein
MCFPLLYILFKEVSPGVCQLQELENIDQCSTDDESLTFKYKDDPSLDDDSNKKEKIEKKEKTEEDKSDKTKKEITEEGGGEETVGRRHWSQFNYRSTSV